MSFCLGLEMFFVDFPAYNLRPGHFVQVPPKHDWIYIRCYKAHTPCREVI